MKKGMTPSNACNVPSPNNMRLNLHDRDRDKED